MAEVKKKSLAELFASVNKTLSKVDLNDIDPNEDYESLPEGYYLTELEKGELTESSSSGKPMFKLQFKVVENGLKLIVNSSKEADLVEAKGTANKKIWKYYIMDEEDDGVSFKRFVKDMLKFEEDGEPILPPEVFEEAELINEAFEVLEGRHIYIHVSTNTKQGKVSTWLNLITWKRAEEMGLPV